MPSVLIIKDKKFFTNLLSGISFRHSATFEITPDCFKISTLQPPYFYLVFDNSLFSVDHPISFTIRVDELKKSLNLLNSSVVYLDKSFKIIEFNGMTETSCDSINKRFTTILQSIENRKNKSEEPNSKLIYDSIRSIKNSETQHSAANDRSFTSTTNELIKANYTNAEMCYNFVEIPFINPINTYYTERSYYPVRFFISKECLRNFLKGEVRYTSDGKKVFLTSQTPEVFERLDIDADFFDASHLDFTCSNDWVNNVLEFYTEIDKVFFCFSNTLLSIKFLFTKYQKSYLEIQVQEKIRTGF